MNEITQIHLGRQPFTISVDAHKELREYLDAISQEVGSKNKEVVEEIELRMAELLAERGITGDKVVLAKDVAYLKEQLGDPTDFKEDGDEQPEVAEGKTVSKRLFRDTQTGMLAGVSSGIAEYLGISPIIVRLLFVVAILSGGWGVLLYIVLWLVIPEAKTSSERLQMRGKAVTVDSLKEVVAQADIEGAAHRASSWMLPVFNKILKVILTVVGLGLMLAGIGMLLGLMAAGIYWVLNPDLVPSRIFPVGAGEVVLIGLGFVALAMVALFFVVTGLAVTKRKWPIPGWGLGAMVAVFLASLAVGGALAADAAPKIDKRYQAATHTYVRTVPEFHKLRAVGNFQSNVRYEESANYEVAVKYWGDADFSSLKTDVKDQTLTVDSRALNESRRCPKLCLFPSPMVEVVVRGPKLQEVSADLQGTQLSIVGVNNQTIKVRAAKSTIAFPDIAADALKAERAGDNTWVLTFAATYTSAYRPQHVSIYEDTATIDAKNINLAFNGQCGVRADLNTSAIINLDTPFEKLTVNGKVIGAPKDLRALQDQPGASPYKCLQMPGMVTVTDNS